MAVSNKNVIENINIHFLNDKTKFVKEKYLEDIRDAIIPSEFVVDGRFIISFSFDKQNIQFELINHYKENDTEIIFLYNPRTRKYNKNDLIQFADIFTTLTIQNDNGEYYTGTIDKLGYLTLTPFILKSKAGDFMSYFILFTGSDGESRYSAYNSKIRIGEIIKIDKTLLDVFSKYYV